MAVIKDTAGVAANVDETFDALRSVPHAMSGTNVAHYFAGHRTPLLTNTNARAWVMLLWNQTTDLVTVISRLRARVIYTSMPMGPTLCEFRAQRLTLVQPYPDPVSPLSALTPAKKRRSQPAAQSVLKGITANTPTNILGPDPNVVPLRGQAQTHWLTTINAASPVTTFDYPGPNPRNAQLRNHYVIRAGDAIGVRVGPSTGTSGVGIICTWDVAWTEIPEALYQTIR